MGDVGRIADRTCEVGWNGGRRWLYRNPGDRADVDYTARLGPRTVCGTRSEAKRCDIRHRGASGNNERG